MLQIATGILLNAMTFILEFQGRTRDRDRKSDNYEVAV